MQQRRTRHLPTQLTRSTRSAWVLAACLAMTGCGGSNAGDAGTDTVKVGFVGSLSGTYQDVGQEMRDGFQLYLDTHDGRFGGRKVDLVVADEGNGAATALPAATRLVKDEHVAALTGIVASGSYLAISALATEHKIPLIGSNGRPDTDNADWLWTTSFRSPDPGTAIAPYIKEHVDGPVWAIGPDYKGGYDQVGGFTDTYTKLGGKLANPGGKPTWTPFPDTPNYLPYLSQIAKSDAKAVYAFFGGANAVGFVTQYRQSDARNLPLYGAFLTEGPVLQQQGAAAEGIWNVLNYSPDLDNAANRTFIADWTTRHADRSPTTYAMAAYDAAAVLDKAIAKISGKVTAVKINEAIGQLGQIDSPRGSWQFSPKNHTPIQHWYLRVVRRDGTQLANRVVQDLATVGA
ncbi:ABC transporter substrate-binding protein [Dactylosporangium sp. CA-152071]|uniref:ABC transporter substrate-binding protein n=1 Tax=Dactylosporangium sp. CA-152071 TaxID=3239933 RepID=UPI003D8A6D40